MGCYEDKMTGGQEGTREVKAPCKGANRSEAPVQKCKSERQHFRWQVAASGLGWRGKNIFGPRVSAVGYQVRVIRYRCRYGPEPVPGAEHLNLNPDGRDLGPENEKTELKGRPETG